MEGGETEREKPLDETSIEQVVSTTGIWSKGEAVKSQASQRLNPGLSQRSNSRASNNLNNWVSKGSGLRIPM
jgi:hypothetical protein